METSDKNLLSPRPTLIKPLSPLAGSILRVKRARRAIIGAPGFVISTKYVFNSVVFIFPGLGFARFFQPPGLGVRS